MRLNRVKIASLVVILLLLAPQLHAAERETSWLVNDLAAAQKQARLHEKLIFVIFH